jgi:hypothetical protein
LLIQNVSQQSITFSSRVSLAGDLHATVETEKGQSVDVAMTDYTGHVLVSRVTLAPQQIMTYDAGNIGLALTKERADKFEGTTDLRLVAPAGRYTVRLSGYFGKKSVGLRDGKGRTLAPLDRDWEGQLTTGLSSLRVEDEVVECSIVDAVTALPVTGWTTTFLYVKPKSADAEEVKISEVMWIADDRTLGRFHFRIPDFILQRADREELEVKWGVQHPDYEPYLSTDRISLKRFFQDGPQAARAVLSTIKLTPKKKAARGD